MYDYLSENIDKKSIISYEKSNIILTLFSSILVFFLIIISLLNFNSKNKLIITLKSKLIKLFILDIIIRLLYIINYFSINAYKEIIISVLTTSQFYYILSFIDQILYNYKESQLKLSKEKNKRIQLCLLFFFLTFSYEKLSFSFPISLSLQLSFNKIILIIKSICIIICLFKLYKFLKKKVIHIGNYLIKVTNKKTKSILFIMGSPISCLFLFTSFYFSNIIFTFIKSPLIYIYGNIVLNIIKDSSKFFIFILCEIIIYNLNKIKMKKELENKYIQKKKIQLIYNSN